MVPGEETRVMTRQRVQSAGACVGLVFGAALLGACAALQVNQAEKTFELDFARVEGATRQALEALEMTPLAREERRKVGISEESLEMTTYARGRKIVIQTDRVSPTGVKVRVDAQRGNLYLQGDKETATEILLKINEMLHRP
jgi:hypothetical protein